MADSSDSETESKWKPSTMAVTPAESTPPAEVELVKVDPAEVGMTLAFKHLYSGKEDKRGRCVQCVSFSAYSLLIICLCYRFQWESKIPEDLGQPAEDAESQKFAIIVRRVKTYNDPTSE